MFFTVQFTVWLLSFFSGVNQELLDSISFTTRKSAQKGGYNELIVEKLIKIITLSSQFGKFSIMISQSDVKAIERYVRIPCHTKSMMFFCD